MNKCIDFEIKIPWMQIEVLPFTSYENLPKLLNLYVPKFPHLYVEAMGTFSCNAVVRTDTVVHVKYLEACLMFISQ